MGPERFVAPTAAEALKLVRKSMGDEAMVLSTRQTPDGVEITAITSEALDQLSGGGAAASSPPARGATSGTAFSADTYGAPGRRGVTSPGPSFPHELVISDVIKSRRNLDGSPVYTPEQLDGTNNRGSQAPTRSSGLDATMAASALAAASANSVEMGKLMLEMAQVKNLLQSHLA